MKDRAPVISVAIVESVPPEVAMPVLVGRQSEEERWSIETVASTELCKLFRRCLIAKDSGRGIAGNKFNEKGDQRDNGPNDQDEKAQATEHSEDFPVHQDDFELPPADDSRMDREYNRLVVAYFEFFASFSATPSVCPLRFNVTSNMNNRRGS